MTTTDSEAIQPYSKWDNPCGITYGAWTAKWWQWILSDSRPLTDQDGKDCNINQPSSDVFFLVGCYADSDPLVNFPYRKVSVEFGKSILIPVLNCEANSLEYPDLTTENELINHVEVDVASVIKKDLFINGKRVEPVRVRSDPEVFKVSINKDTVFRPNKSGLTDAVADGYWIFLKPLPKGKYHINLEGSCESGRLKSGATYDLKII